MIKTASFPTFMRQARWWNSTNKEFLQDLYFSSSAIVTISGISETYGASQVNVTVNKVIAGLSETLGSDFANVTLTALVGGSSETVDVSNANYGPVVTFLISGNSESVSQTLLDLNTGIKFISCVSQSVGLSNVIVTYETAFQRFTNSTLDTNQEFIHMTIEAVG